ncbi:MAG: large repetitive protein [Thermoplasmata archaeon]|jgi:hypothetical protein|nr:large repetitive protein [Thermoplasmata archaeon]
MSQVRRAVVSARALSQARPLVALLALLMVVAPALAPATQAITVGPADVTQAVQEVRTTATSASSSARAAVTEAVLDAADPALDLALAELDQVEAEANAARDQALALLAQDAAWRDEVRAIPEALYGVLAILDQTLADARQAADPRPYLAPLSTLVAEQAALVEELRAAVAAATDVAPDAPVEADAPDEPTEQEHVHAAGYGEEEHADGQAGRVFADDLADDLGHRAYFAMDRNWAVVGAPISVASLSKPAATLAGVQWHFDEHPIAGVGFVGGDSGANAAAIVPSFEGDRLSVRPMRSGLHHLTLTATWEDADGTHLDRVTTPIYVEDPAIATLQALPPPSEWEADVVGALTSLKPGDATGAGGLDGLLLRDRPTVLLISDFLGGYDPPAGVVAPTQGALDALAESVASFDPDAGLGQIEAWGVTDYGADITHHGGAMAATLVEAGLANVVFASGIDPDTGVLDRAAIRNALLYAQHSGNIDAVLWGLPASAYLPGVLQNAARPNLNFQSTPMLPLAADAPLPAAARDWRAAPLMPADTSSVLTDLMKLGFALDPGSDGTGLIGRLHANLDQVYNRYKPLVEAVHNDLQFDAFLQTQLLALGEQGIPTVVPAEECAALASTYMTVLGLGHLVGTYTVAAGTKDDGVDPTSCKGPDRRAHGHGQGIDFVADPRPAKATLLDAVLPEARLIPYVEGSLGAAAKVAAKLADLRFRLRDDGHPWQGQDLAGILASHAESSDLSPWAEGIGFVDVDGIPSTLPRMFARQTGVTFQPFDLEAGKATGFAQVVVTGPDAATALATAATWDAEGGTQWRMADDGWGGRAVEQVTPETPGHIGVHQGDSVATAVAPDVTIVTMELQAEPATTSGGGWMGTPWAPPRDWLLPGLYSGRTWISTSAGVLQLPINLGVGTIVDVYRFLAPDKPVGDTLVCLALPDIVGDVLGLRETSHELGLDELCLYVASTDVHGIARFYTPLPVIPYKLISWFDGRFNTRGGGIGKVYPHIEVEDVAFPLPLNLAGAAAFAAEAVGSVAGYNPPPPDQLPEEGLQLGWAEVDATPENETHPIFVRADLPYPLLYVPINMTFQLAIAVNWRYRDNMETDHFVPVATTDVLGVLDLLSGGRLPGFVSDVYFEAVQTSDVLTKAAQGIEAQVLGAATDLPGLNGTILDDILGQGVLKSLPALSDVPGTCSWGYGHATSPALTPEMAPILAADDHAGWSAASFLADKVRPAVDREAKDPNQFAWPDTLTMRSRPTIENLLTMGLSLPLCTAAYPFNVPQPNYYPTSVVHSFNLGMENTILIVCISAGMDTVCWIILAGPEGPAIIVPWDLDAKLRELLKEANGLVNFGIEPLPEPADPTLADLTAGIRGLANVPQLNVDLPVLPGIQVGGDGGRITLATDLVTAGAQSGLITYTAIPLAVADTGLLDPIVGILTANGIDVASLARSARIDMGLPGGGLVDGAVNVTADLPALLRDSIQDLLGIESKVAISRGSLDLNAWWWDDSFFDAPIALNAHLPRSTTTDCLRSWDVATDPDLMAGPRWPADGDDPTCLRDADGDIVLQSGTVGTPNGGFDLGEDWWWRTFPNVDRQLFERGMRYWDPATLVPDRAAMQADGYPWAQPEMFEVLLEQFDDEEITGTLPNQNHFHAGNGHNAHDFVSTAAHCTREQVYDTITGDPLLNENGEYCYEGLLAFEEGNGYLFHDNTRDGSGIYDPDMGLGGVDAKLLPLLDLLGAPTVANPVVWSLGFEWGGTRATTPGLVENVTGHDPRELDWWSRGVSFTANRTIYSDQYSNTTLLLGDHFKPCEEISLFSRAPLFRMDGVYDKRPRWQVACPMLPGPTAVLARQADPTLPVGYVPAGFADPAAPAYWDWQPRRMDMGPDAQLLTAPTVDGWVQDGPLLAPWLEAPSEAPEGQAWFANEGVRCRRERWMGWAPGADAQARQAAIVRFYGQQAQDVHEVRVVVPEAGRSSLSGFKDECATYDGWTYWVRADVGFNGGAVPRWNAYIRNLHPLYSNGTFAVNLEAWNQCRATADHKLDGWSCAAPDPIAQAWRDLLAQAAVRHEEYVQPTTGAAVTTPLTDDVVDRYWVAKALDFFGMNVQESGYDYDGATDPTAAPAGVPVGPDRTERVVTVPLAANPDGWYGLSPDATEWDALFHNLGLRQADWNPNDPSVQVGGMALLQDSLADLSFLLRAYLEGDQAAALAWLASERAHPTLADPEIRKADYYEAAPAWTGATTGPNPFWTDVSGHLVPYVELDRPRRDPTGAPCVGHFWLGECHRFEVKMDAGDLTGIRAAGPWEKDRAANGAPLPKDKTAFIPQGSSYARWNRQHRVPVDLAVDGGLAIDELHALPATVSSCPGAATDFWIRTAEARHAPDGWTAAFLGPAGAPTASLPGWWTMTACAVDTTPWEAWAALVHFEPGAHTDPVSYALPPALGAALLPGDDVGAVKLLHAYYTFGETDPNDPIGKARVTVTTREAPSAEHPLGRDLGCWIDRRAQHGTVPHLEFRQFDTTFWNGVVRSGFYHNVEENAHQSWNGVSGLGGLLSGDDYDAQYDEPVPATRYGPWCVVPGEGGDPVLVPARSDREYIQQRLAWNMQGGTRHANRTMLAPANPFGPVGRPMEDSPLQLDVGALLRLLDALLNDVTALADLGIPVPDLSGAVAGVVADTRLLNHTGDIAQAAKDLRTTLEALPIDIGIEASAPDLVRFDLASPVVPLARVSIASDVTVAEAALRQTHSFPPGTQGIFLASLDGETWHHLPGRLRVGVTSGDAEAGERMEFLDLSAFRGQSVLLGTQLLGAGWGDASWRIDGLQAYGTGVATGVGPAMDAFPGSLGGAVAFDPPHTPGQTWASLGALAPGSVVHLKAPLTIPTGQTLTLNGVKLVAGRCGAAACAITVDGTLRMTGGEIAPATVAAPDASQVAQGALVQVHGLLEASGTTLRGLLGGIHVLGGKLVARDCWVVDTGVLGIASLFGELDVQDCVFMGQTVGLYTLGSRVRVEDNLFARMDRVAGAFDDSWGTLRGNAVLHAEKAGFLVKGILGAQNLAILDNVVRETSTGMGSLFALEQRILALDPLHGGVPLSARTRYQGNDIEFATLEGLFASDLAAPYFVGNDVTHDGYGATNGMLSDGAFHHNSLYTNFNGWMDPVRADPPQGDAWFEAGNAPRPFAPPVRRGPVPEDGNLLGGARGHSVAPGAMDYNYWGPERVGGSPEGRVPKGPGGFRLAAPPDKPMMAALTAPAYGGGALPDLLDATGGVLDPATDILGVGGDSQPFAGLPDLVDVDQVKLGLFRDRLVPLEVDVPPGVTAVTVQATFRETGFMQALQIADLDELADTSLEEFVGSLRDLVGTIVDDPAVTRTETWTLTVPGGQSHAGRTFAFDGIREAYVDVEVASFTVDPALWSPARMAAMGAVAVGTNAYQGDVLLTKDVRVHNSITWPLLLDLTTLVHDLTFTVVNETLATFDQTVLGVGLTASIDGASNAGLPVLPMPDGTLPLHGVPDLLTLAKDQDPVRGIEARFELGADATALAGVLTGIGMDKSVALPDVPEGLTLAVEARAMDASNLVSPWVGVRLLTDLHPPAIALDSECLSDTQGGVPYEVHEWRGTGWTAAHRASGVSNVAIRVAPAIEVEGGPQPFRVDLPFPGDDVTGAIPIPSYGMVDGMVYQVRGVAQDRAGNAGSDELTRLVVDLSGPRIQLGTLLDAIVSRAQSGKPFVGLGDLVGGKLAIRVDVDDGPTAVAEALRNSCGLLEASLEMRTAANGPWTTLASWSGDSGANHADLDHDLDVAAALSGRYLELRVRARDGANHQAEATTGNLLADLTIPVPIVLPDLPACVGDTLGTVAVQWGGRELIPTGGLAGSGLASGELVALKGAATTTLDQFTAPVGTMAVQQPYSLDPVARLTDGSYVLAVRLHDHAGNSQLWSSVSGLTPAQAAEAVALGALAVDPHDPVLTEQTFRHWEGTVASLLTSDPLNGDLVNVDAAIDDALAGIYSCGLKVVQLFLDSAAGTELLSQENPTGTAQPFYGRGVNLATKPALDGRTATLRVRAEDNGGNVRQATSPTFLVDLTAPVIGTLPTLPACVGTAGAAIPWTTVDGAPSGVGYPYTPSGLATDRARVYRNGIATSTYLAPGAAWAPGTGDHGVGFTFRVEAADRAGNAAAAKTFATTVTADLTGPPLTLGLAGLGMQLVPLPGGADDGAIHLYATPGADVGCAGAAGLKVMAQRVVDGADWGSPVDITATAADWSDPLSTNAALHHHNVKYKVYAQDSLGNKGATKETQQLHVDYRYPNIDLGSTAAFFGRLVATGTDLGNPYTGVLDLGPGFGTEDGAGLATVVGPNARLLSGYTTLPIRATVTMPGAVAIKAGPTATMDGLSAGLSGTGPWTHTYNVLGAAVNAEHAFVASVTGSNGLTGQARHRVFVPQDSSTMLEESAWTKTGTGTGDRLFGSPTGTTGYALRIDASTTQAVDLRRTVANPSPRLAVAADVRLERKDATGDLRVLDVLDTATTSRAALVVKDATRELFLRTSAGDTATGKSLPLGSYTHVALVLRGTIAELHVGGAFVGEYAVPAATAGVAALATGGTGGKVHLDNVQVHGLELSLKEVDPLPFGDAGAWTPVGLGVTLTSVGFGTDTATKIQATTTAEATMPFVESGTRGQATVHFLQSATISTSEVARFVDADGDAVLTAKLGGNRLLVSDGLSGFHIFSTPLNLDWHRLDVFREGSDVFAQLDQGTAVKLAASSPDPIADVAAGRGGTVYLGDARSLDSVPFKLDNSRGLSEAGGWTVGGTAAAVTTAVGGHWTPGAFSVDPAANEAAYLAVDVAPAGSAYTAKASFRPPFAGSPAADQWVLAFLDASLAPKFGVYSLPVGAPGAYAGYDLVYRDPAGGETTVAEVRGSNVWQTVAVKVDAKAGTVEVLANGVSFGAAAFAPFPAIAKVAAGDVSTAAAASPGPGEYDDLVLLPGIN